jgi:pimeloyl-ACP methyl ester carboxylesterase
VPTVERPGGVGIYYESTGSGPPIALAHGFGVSREMWSPQRAQPSELHRLILWDARGHGSSSTPSNDDAYSMPVLAEDLAAVLDDAGEALDTVIGGMSFGGMIALQFAVDYPARTRALILSDSVPRGAEEQRNTEPPNAGGPFLSMLRRPDLTDALPSLTVPVLVLYGEYDLGLRDGVVTLANALPERRMVCLEGCGHGTSAQRPWDWTHVVLEFLEDVEAGRSVRGEATI